jgi:hypothetical protein
MPLLELAVPVTISDGSLTSACSGGFRNVTARGAAGSAGAAGDALVLELAVLGLEGEAVHAAQRAVGV